MKEKNYNRDYIRKKRSQEAFLTKAKIGNQLTEHSKYLQPRKTQTRMSTSLLDVCPSEVFRRVDSLQIPQSQIAVVEEFRPARNGNKAKRDINHSWSERNIVIVNEQSKMQKLRKFSSNAELRDQDLKEHSKRKLSLIQERNQFQTSNNYKVEALNSTTWIILIRKLFAEQFYRRTIVNVKLSLLLSYIRSLQKEGLKEFQEIVQPLEYQYKLTRNQMVALLQQFFSIPKSQLKGGVTDSSKSVSFLEVLNCLVQHQLKNTTAFQPKQKSSSSEEEPIETARFQEGGNQQQKRKRMMESRHYDIVPNIGTYKKVIESGKQTIKIINQEEIDRAYFGSNKRKQSLSPSLSPVASNQIKKDKVPYDNYQSLNPKKAIIKNHSRELLGMLTLEGKSPRQLMVSEIYESMQKQGISHKNNISFSLENIETELHLSFEHTVHSFEAILRKIKGIQRNYQNKFEEETKGQENGKETQQVNKFLEQLINYRMAMSSQHYCEDNYSYFVSFQNITPFKEQNKGIMSALLQSSYMKEYFAALEGIKIDSSEQLFKHVSPFLHQGIRILNLSGNHLNNISELLKQTPRQNAMELLNLNNNLFTDICPLLEKFKRLKELHCCNNLISVISEEPLNDGELKIIDLGLNKIEHEKSLIGLKSYSSLDLINIMGNPLVKIGWKLEWSGAVNISKIYEMDNLYMMSAYGHQKDIAFSIDKPKKNVKDKLRSDTVQQFTIHDQCDLSKEARRLHEDKQNVRELPKMEPAKSQIEKEQPKQKISKIKAYVDGKII